MQGRTTVALFGLTFIAVMSTYPTKSAASEASSASSLLTARNMTEKEYLDGIVPVFRKLYGPMAEPAATLIWQNAGPVFAVDAMTLC
jgi:hypothetical protein